MGRLPTWICCDWPWMQKEKMNQQKSSPKWVVKKNWWWIWWDRIHKTSSAKQKSTSSKPILQWFFVNHHPVETTDALNFKKLANHHFQPQRKKMGWKKNPKKNRGNRFFDPKLRNSAKSSETWVVTKAPNKSLAPSLLIYGPFRYQQKSTKKLSDAKVGH